MRQIFKELYSVSGMLKRMETQGLVTISKRSGKSILTAKLTKKGEEIFNQSLHNEVDKRILSVLPKKQFERLASDMWAVRNKALRELGISE